MANPHLKFIIVGHLDHGKSTFIGRLLYDTHSLPPDKIEEIKKCSQDLGRETEFAAFLDHLEEEQKQKMTIDLTQVFFETKKRNYIIIDAPGHVEFMQNMISGASQAEAAVLIVDVKEGIKEQTKRHAHILSLLGLKQVIIVLNKMDLVDFKAERFNQVKREIVRFLQRINIEPAFNIPVSALKGENIARQSYKMNWYKGATFLACLDRLKTKAVSKNQSLIFPVQDIYRMNGKRIIVGRIESGFIQRGCGVKILPSGCVTKVKSIEQYLKRIDTALSGQSIGITLESPVFIKRGDVICLPEEEGILADEFCASIFWMAKKDFHQDEHLTLRCATQQTTCKIKTIKKRINSATLEIIEENATQLKNLEVGEVSLSTERPIAIKKFNALPELGRFIFTRDRDICAGGIITSIDVKR